MPMNHFLLLIGVAAVVSIPSVQAGPILGATKTAPFSLEPEQSQANSARRPLDAAKAPERPYYAKNQPFASSTLAPTPRENGDTNDIDVRALRYFVSQGDMKRVSAEIHLIRSKHPDWEPEEDLLADSGATIDESLFWTKFATGDFAGVRADIEKTKVERPGWQPSGDLSNKLATAEAYQAMIAASQDGRWQDVLKTAADSKQLLTCSYVDALWRVAEALVHTDNEPRAVEAYGYILTNCNSPKDRLATAHKAVALLKSPASIDQVLAYGHKQPDGRDEFESARFDRLRQTIGAASVENTAAPRPDPQELSAFAQFAGNAGAQDDEMLLGWYAYALKDYTQAEDWFRKANASSPFAKAAEGLVRTLLAQDKTDEALQTAMKYYRLGAPNKTLLAETELQQLESHTGKKLSADDAAALTSAIDDTKDANSAQRFGWRLYDAGDAAQARKWFEKSIAWSRSEPAALGLMVASFRLRDFGAYNDAANKYRDEYPKVAEYAMRMGRYIGASHNKISSRLYRSATHSGKRSPLAAARHVAKTLAFTRLRASEHISHSARLPRSSENT